MDIVLHFLDARDLVTLAEVRLLPASVTSWPKGAAFVAKRVLSASELEWFTARKIPVSLLPVECLTDQIYLPHVEEVTRWMFAPRIAKYQWTLPGTSILHRDHDLPAVEWDDDDDGGGTHKEWWHNGKLHRDGGLPAIEYTSGRREWFQHGQLHRDGDLPAIESTTSRIWYLHGELHRDGDRPAGEHANGQLDWFQHGKLHRDGGRPAIEYANGKREWWVHGMRHRWWGPAIVWSNGSLAWYWYGVSFNQALNFLFVIAYITGLVGMNVCLLQGSTSSVWLNVGGALIYFLAFIWSSGVCYHLKLHLSQFNVFAVTTALNVIGVAFVVLLTAAAVRP